MDNAYNFRAPRYVDFLNAVHDNEETDFFDYDLDTGVPLKQKSPFSVEENIKNKPTLPNNDVNDEPTTPYQDAESSYNSPEENSPEENSPISRRHTRHQSLPRRSIFDGIELEPPHSKAHTMKTRLDRRTKTPRLDLRSRSIVRASQDSPQLTEHQAQEEIEDNGTDNHMERGETHEVINKQNRKSIKRKRNHSEAPSSTNEEAPAKFISMAEHIRKLQKQTPARFHTRPRFDGVTKKVFGGPPAPKQVTVPHTPALVSHLRHRPVYALTREEEELKEFEDAQKAKFKAAPLKENVFKSHRVAVVEKRPPTEVKPFRLTEYRPKPKAPDEAPVVFKARPVPKTVFSGPKVEAPKRKRADPPPPAPISKPTHANPAKIARTEIQPFSFDGRELALKEKREQLSKEKEEMERKAREFKARPVPSHKGTVERSAKVTKCKTQSEQPPPAEFKARSPAVLRHPPFVPLKTPRSPLEQKPFALNTEVRAKNREKFDLTIKEKEAELELQKRQQEEEEARKTAEEVARWRQEAVHHARPVPQHKPFQVKPSNAPLTDPHSPSFIKRLRERKPTKADQLNSTFDVES